MSAILFLWLILNAPLRTAAPLNNTFLAHAQEVVKMAWYGDERCKQRTVTEFFVAEKQSVTNIHKRLGKYTVSLLVAELHELQVLRKARRTASGSRVRGFDHDRSHWIFSDVKKSSACLPSEGK
jgi:hypothetical protein